MKDLVGAAVLTAAVEYAYTVTHSHGHWQEAPVSCHMGLFVGLPLCHHDVAAGFSSLSNVRGRKASRSHNFCYNLAS